MSEVTPIPATKKAKKIKAKTSEIPQDLQDAWAAVVAIATTHKLLQEGHFQYAHRNSVGVSIAFMEELHVRAFQNASEHPKAEMIPELKQLMEKAALDGKTKEN